MNGNKNIEYFAFDLVLKQIVLSPGVRTNLEENIFFLFAFNSRQQEQHASMFVFVK